MFSKGSSITGYIEVKDIDYNLNKTEKSRWLGHYRDSCVTKDIPLSLCKEKGLMEWSDDCLMVLWGAFR